MINRPSIDVSNSGDPAELFLSSDPEKRYEFTVGVHKVSIFSESVGGYIPFTPMDDCIYEFYGIPIRFLYGENANDEIKLTEIQ